VIFPVFLLAWLRFAIAAVAMTPWLRRPADEAPPRRAHASPALPRVVLRQLPVLDLHARGRLPQLGARGGRDHGGDPAVVAVLSWLILGERPGVRVMVGIAFAIAGIALVSFARDAGGELASGSLLGASPPPRRGLLRIALRRARQEALGADRAEADQRP
jgi:hypothetical protein